MAGSWPKGLSDREAIERLESLLITAIEGNRDLITEKEYRAFRSAAIARDDLRDVLPQFLRAQRDLTAFAAYIRKIGKVGRPVESMFGQASNLLSTGLKARLLRNSDHPSGPAGVILLNRPGLFSR